MSVLSPDLVRRIRRRHHVVSAAELVHDGLSQRDLAGWIATRVLTEVAPGVFAVTDALRAQPFLTRAAAACLDGDRVCDALSSARCWQLPGVFAVSRPRTIHRRTVPSDHVVERDDGIRAMSPAATWFGLSEVLRPHPYRDWSSVVLNDRIDVARAHEVVAAIADHRRPPHRRAAAVLSSQRSWQRPPGGELERRVRASFRRRGITGLDGAHRISLDGGFVVHTTAVDHDLRWGVEIDHLRWHGGRLPEGLRRWVDRRLHDVGWTIEYVSDHRLHHDFAAAMRALTASYHAAGATAA